MTEENSSTKGSGEKSKRKMDADGDGDGDGPPSSKKANQGREGPDHWVYAPPMGKVILNKFLPMKTPLGEGFDREIPAGYRFHPADVFDLHPKGKIRIWFDLTMSERYYKSKEVGEQGCRYFKLRMDGHSGPPSRGQICEFIGLVKKHYDVGLIAVHCTHGFNRTGFAIVSYLVEVEKMKVMEAIQLYREARPDGIYKQDYLDELIHRYGAGEVVKARSPNWKKGPIATDDYHLGYPKMIHMHRVSQAHRPRVNYSALEHLGGSQPPPPARRSQDGLHQATYNDHSRHSRDSRPQFMADLPLQYLDDKAESDRVRKMVAEWLDVKRADLFAGSQPVSMEGPLGNKNYAQLFRNQYLVSWKADGTRCLLVIEGPGEVYALNRNNDVFLVKRLTFPKAGGPGHVEETLLDVEVVVDEVGGQRIPRLLVYDMMRCEGEDVMQKPFVERFALIQEKVVGPRDLAFQRGEMKREQECAGVRIKGFFSLDQAGYLVSPRFLQQMTHHADGLIFQPANEPYKPGAFKLLMKWKSLEESTVDFKLKIEKWTPIGQMPRQVAALYVLHFQKPFATIEPVTDQLRSYHNKIVECSFPPQGRQWKVERVREDKTKPNAHATADSVATTIRHQFTRGDLLHCIDSIIKNQGHRGS